MTRTIRIGSEGTYLTLRALILRAPGQVTGLNVSYSAPDIAAAADLAFQAELLDAENLAWFFEEMARNWRGWNEPIGFRTSEGDFTLSADCDRIGHVTIRSRIITRRWSLDGRLHLEAGMLEALATTARRLLLPADHEAR
ncbi:DUF6228 family protein [Marinimicrococcus flavescens]|uniref:DUF6228 family protein n=1 Tax=Marinimicrococcus flavescens TaxID=3031815 RepID=A0AAP3UY42_9PROT|nr:DUF6228 family protein [Marinimicrococcus flavescens]